MDPITISAGIAALGTIGSTIGGMFGQKSTNETNVKLAAQQNAWNLEQWNRENEYNLPSNQLARLKAAGLNPNLIYGSGGATTTSASSPRATRAEVSNPTAGLTTGVAQAMGFLMQGIMNQQSVNKMQAQTELLKTQKDTQIVNQQYGLSNVAKNEAATALMGEQRGLATLNKDLITQRIKNVEADTLLKGTQTWTAQINNATAAERNMLDMELKQTAIALNKEQIQAISEKIAQAWAQIGINQNRYEQSIPLIRDQMESLQRGSNIKWVQAQLLQQNLDFNQAEKATGIIATFLKLLK